MSFCSYLLLLDKISFTNLAYVSIGSDASIRGILIYNCLNTLGNLVNCLSNLAFLCQFGNGGEGEVLYF